MDLALAILWTIILVFRIMEYQSGATPSWGDVFIPLATLAALNWIDAIFDYINRH